MSEPEPQTSRPKKFFDIVPPGQTAPSATTRPVIVGNKPEQVDSTIKAPTEPSAVAVPIEPANEPEPNQPPTSEPLSPLPIEQVTAPQIITHQARAIHNKHWLWLAIATILIITILDLLQHYGKL